MNIRLRKRLDNEYRKKLKEGIMKYWRRIFYGGRKKCFNWIPNMDMTAEILSRLPIKSIIRFMLVCKSWRDIIASPGFSSMHAKNNPLYAFAADDVTATFKNPINERVRINSCPAGKVHYRFGYSPSTKECKVLRCNHDQREYHILTVGVDQGWRKLSPQLFPICMEEHCNDRTCMLPSFNGAFHWLAIDTKAIFILAFDVAKESTERIPYFHQTLRGAGLVGWNDVFWLPFRDYGRYVRRTTNGRNYCNGIELPNRAFVLRGVGGDANNYIVDFVASLADDCAATKCGGSLFWVKRCGDAAILFPNSNEDLLSLLPKPR